MGNNHKSEGGNRTGRSSRRRLLKTVGAGAVGVPIVSGTAAAGGYDHAETDDHEWGMSDYYNWDGNYEVQVSWSWYTDGDSHDDSTINDGVGIYWDDDKWELITADYTHSLEVTFDGTKIDSGVKGVAWEHDQYAAVHDYDDGTSFNAVTELKPKGDYSSYPVYGEYFHTWDDTDINGLGLQSDGFYVQWETSGEQWDKHKDYYPLR